MAEARDLDASTRRRRRLFFIIVGAALLATIVGVGLLMNIFERKQEARNPFYRVVELTDETEDPAVWGKNFPLQYDDYKRTVDQVRTRYGGSEALPHTPGTLSHGADRTEPPVGRPAVGCGHAPRRLRAPLRVRRAAA